MPYEVFTIEVSHSNKHLTLVVTLFTDCRHFMPHEVFTTEVSSLNKKLSLT